MVDFEKLFERPGYATQARESHLAATFRVAYGWMCAGLALSGLIAWYAASSGLAVRLMQGGGFTVCLIAEVALVFALSAAIRKLPVAAACLMFMVYAALNGLTLSTIFFAYELGHIARVFFITAGMFGGLALWGTFTRSNLASVGAFCGMALWGLVIACLVNLFLHSTGLDLVVSILGIVVFAGLTMFDAQKIKALAASEAQLDAVTAHKLGLLGALSLYLDFINLFLYLLRFMGRKR